MTEKPTESRAPEPEHKGPIWKHPLWVYAVLHILIIGVIFLIGWMALENNWVQIQP